MLKEKISVVLPIYNNANTLVRLVAKIDKFMKNHRIKKYEIIMADDGSKDSSWKLIGELCSKKKNRIGIKLRRNFGQNSALISGLEAASGDLIFTMDADLQQKVDDLGKFLKKIKSKENIDMVLGRRTKYNPSFIKKFGSKIFFHLFRLFSNIKIQDSTSFRLMKRKVIEELMKGDKNNIQLSITPFIFGFNVDYIDIKWDNSERPSSYTFAKSLKLAIHNLFFYTSLNVIIPITLTLFILFLLIILIIYFAYTYFAFGIIVPGYLSIIFLILFGFIMNLGLFLSLIISMNNINKIIKDKRNYIVEEKLNHV